MIRSAQATPSAATSMPPPTVEETAWDILLALHSDRGCELRLDKLARLVSVSPSALYRWLELLERRRLVASATHRFSRELCAALTPAGRELLDRYLSAAADLQVGAHD
jgi:DNA-binding MarR family transcriptional regulator